MLGTIDQEIAGNSPEKKGEIVPREPKASLSGTIACENAEKRPEKKKNCIWREKKTYIGTIKKSKLYSSKFKRRY